MVRLFPALGALALALALPSGPVSAQGAQTVDLGMIGAWRLERTGPAEAPQSCAVWLMTGQEQGIRFQHGGSLSRIDFVALFSAAQAGPQAVTYSWNGDAKEQQTEAMTLDPASGNFWRGMVISNDMPDGRIDLFANATSVTFAYDGGAAGPQAVTFPLTGSARAMRAALDCAMPGSSGGAAPAGAGQPYVLTGSCRLVVDGRTHLNRRGDCPIWMQNDGTGAFWINTDRETTLGEYFASIEPRGDGTAQGHWNALPGATHAQAFLGEDFRMGLGGCWSNARATICAER